MHQIAVTFKTDDDLRLEGRLLEPPRPAGAAVVCHPHPLHQGSMSSLPIPNVHRAIGRRGWAALRFNFRGVGRSEGRFDEGRGEQRDVRAAVDFLAARHPGLPLAVAGWSFGSLVSLAAVAGDERVQRYVAIAPPVEAPGRLTAPISPAPERVAGWKAAALAVIGSEDVFASPPAVRSWADDMFGGRCLVEVFEGFDHSFARDREALADRVASFLTQP